MPNEPGEVDMRIVRVCRDTLEINTLYDIKNDPSDIYGPTLIGIASEMIFFSTAAYPFGNYQYTKVMDLEGNRLDRRFRLINYDTPPES